MGSGGPLRTMEPMNEARPHHLYIVDDSAAIRERIHEMISPMAWIRVVGHATDAPSAVTDILALRPDTVLLDLELQDSNGLQVLRTVHPQMPQVRFVILSNHSEPQYRRACSRAGASEFIDKAHEFERVREVFAGLATRH